MSVKRSFMGSFSEILKIVKFNPNHFVFTSLNQSLFLISNSWRKRTNAN